MKLASILTRPLAHAERRRGVRNTREDKVEPGAADQQEARQPERQPRGPPPGARAAHGQRRQRHRQRERDHIALRMVPDDRDPEEEHIGREGADRDDDAEHGEASGGCHMRILPQSCIIADP